MPKKIRNKRNLFYYRAAFQAAFSQLGEELKILLIKKY